MTNKIMRRNKWDSFVWKKGVNAIVVGKQLCIYLKY